MGLENEVRARVLRRILQHLSPTIGNRKATRFLNREGT